MQKHNEKITVYVNDNFHYMDKSERYEEGKFATKEEALAVCMKIVDEYLLSAFEPGMSQKDLYRSYVCFGDDPWVSGYRSEYSSWKYAKTRSGEICAHTTSVPDKMTPVPEEQVIQVTKLAETEVASRPSTEIKPSEEENRILTDAPRERFKIARAQSRLSPPPENKRLLDGEITKGKQMKTYTAWVDEEFGYDEEEVGYSIGAFSKLEFALEACRKDVDEDLLSMLEPNMTANSLFSKYKLRNDNTRIVEDPDAFCALEYAKQRTKDLYVFGCGRA
jgi:hypothetical protein